MVEREGYNLENEIHNQLDYLNDSQTFTRKDFVWCYKTIKQLLYELHVAKELNKENT